MTDRTFAEKGRAAAGREHRRGAFGGLRRLRRDRRWRRRPPANIACTGTRTSSKVFCPASELSARLDGLDRLIRRRDEIGARRVLRKRLAELHEESADERPGGAADLHHQCHADRLQHLGQRLVRKAGSVASTASKPRFMLIP